MKTIKKFVDGMDCGSCALSIERAVNSIDGVNNCYANFMAGTVYVNFDENSVADLSVIDNKITQAGFKPREGVDESANAKMQTVAMLKRVSIAGVIWVAMVLQSIFLVQTTITALIEAVVTIIAMSTVGYMFYAQPIKSVLQKNYASAINMNLLVMISTITAYVVSFINTISPFTGLSIVGGELYYQSIISVILFITVGHYIEQKVRENNVNSVEALLQFLPNKAHKVVGTEIVETKLSDIKKGDILRFYENEIFNIDGDVVDGSAEVDETILTGEANHIMKAKGKSVFSGTKIVNGTVDIQIKKRVNDTMLSDILMQTETSILEKSKTLSMIDTVSFYFTPFIVLVAIAGFGFWFTTTGDIVKAFDTFLTVLVVSCPCAIGVAIPLSTYFGTNTARKNGILIKNPQIINSIKNPQNVFFDKTGTITEGHISITDFEVLSNSPYTVGSIMNAIATLEKLSNHPIARSIHNYAIQKNGKYVEYKDFENIVGRGIAAKVKLDENDDRFLQVHIINKKSLYKYTKNLDKLTYNDNASSFILVEGELVATITLQDEIRHGMSEVIENLHKNNYKVTILSGDRSENVAKVAKEIGVDAYYSELSPRDKLNMIKQVDESIMIGDGLNDIPSLSHADISVSVADGSNVSSSAGDIVINGEQLKMLPNIITYLTKIRKNAKINLILIFLYNLIIIPIALGVMSSSGIPSVVHSLQVITIDINPTIAAVFMELPVIIVMLNSMRLNFQLHVNHAKANSNDNDKGNNNSNSGQLVGESN